MESKIHSRFICSELKVEDWARLAAFIDGEGCIFIRRSVATRGRNPRFQLVLNITNTDPRLLVWLGRFGKASFYSRKVDGQRDRHEWTVSSRRAAEILTGCLPYFVMKRDQALMGLAFQQTKKYLGGGRKLRASEETVKEWEGMHIGLRNLKTPPTTWEGIVQ